MSAVKERLRKGLSNGQSKDIVREMVLVVRLAGVCMEHNMDMTL